MPGELYVVGTPIGNLADLSSRAIETLRSASIVYAEDTRRTRVLLRHIGSPVPLRSLHVHNEPARVAEIVERVAAGERCALVTDAGMPGISDPGGRVVAAVAEAGAPVVAVPGPSAVVTALAVSGLPAERFASLGFPPRGGRRRREWLDLACRLPLTVVAFESPKRLGALLAALVERGAGGRRCVVCRELTKVHEEVRRGTVASLADYYTGEEPRGEVTVVLERGGEPGEGVPADDQEAERAARELAMQMAVRGCGTREIVRVLMEERGLPRNRAYEIGLRAAEEVGR